MMAPSWSKRSQNSRKLGQLCPNICLRQTLVGFWPAVGCEPLNPAKGSSAVRPWQCRRPSLLSVGEKGCDPYHRPYKHTAIDNVLWLSHFFGSRWVNMAQHKTRPKMGQHRGRGSNSPLYPRGHTPKGLSFAPTPLSIPLTVPLNLLG